VNVDRKTAPREWLDSAHARITPGAGAGFLEAVAEEALLAAEAEASATASKKGQRQ
jgi:hypothetical protein